MQDMLCHGLALEVQALTHVVQALQSEGLIWKALDLLMLTHQVQLYHSDVGCVCPEMFADVPTGHAHIMCTLRLLNTYAAFPALKVQALQSNEFSYHKLSAKLIHGIARTSQAIQPPFSRQSCISMLKTRLLQLQASPSVKLQHKDYMALADWGLALSGTATTAWLLIQLHTIQAIKFYTLPTTASGGGTEPHSTSSITGVADIDPSATIMEADQHAVNLTGLHTKMAIAVVLSWAAQLSHCKSTASIKIVHTTISFILGTCACV